MLIILSVATFFKKKLYDNDHHLLSVTDTHEKSTSVVEVATHIKEYFAGGQTGVVVPSGQHCYRGFIVNYEQAMNLELKLC